MTTHALFIGYDRIRDGKGAPALDLIGQFLAFWSEQVKQGTIDSFEPVLLTPHGGDLNGFVLVKGDWDSLAKIRSSDGFLRLATALSHCCVGFGIVDGFVGESVAEQMERYREHALRERSDAAKG